MFITALCPTYRRPKLLANAIAQFQAQDHPDKEMIILDDAQQILEQSGENWRLYSAAARYPSLPEKYAAMIALADPRTEAFVIWEDDDRQAAA